MESIVLDTNVVSELMRSQPEQTVMDWFARRTGDIFYVSAITRAEIMLGISLLPAGKRRDSLASAADGMFLQDFAGRCLPFDAAGAAHYAAVVSGRRRAGQAISTEDALIAAIALAHGYPLATRNTKDFLSISGLTLYNPWQTS
ncbi:MAG: type II toxin-antitoxin system VapC family toxin [Geobacteraceae bacterium]|nr:type II toxin-antitoxin system VapC family toxin [Geobacteraceae bacterium]